MKHNRPDTGLKIVVFTLLILGTAILFSASAVISIEKTGNPYYYFFHQLIYGVIPGIVLFFVCQRINYKFWKKISLPLFVFSLILMLLVFVPGMGLKYKGAQRWLDLKLFSIQPSEFLKLALIFYFSALFEKRKTGSQKTTNFLLFFVIMAIISGLLTLQSDVGTLTIFFIVGMSIYWLSGADLKYIITTILIYAFAFYGLVRFYPHRLNRIITFFNPEIDPLGISYQINQAILAIGSGGLFGLGPGNSMQKRNFLPEPINDSIFAITAEEIGFVGSCLIIALFVFLAIRGLKIAKNAPDGFAKLTAIGIVSWITFQVIINIGAITKLLPLTGITLPLFSYGGSSLVVIMAALGILTNISKYKI